MTSSPRRLWLLSLLALLLAPVARADVTLAPLFADHAVLQCDKPVPVWGRADAGEKVVVKFAGQACAATAASDGRWIVYLDALTASAEGADLVVTGKNTLAVHDIVVGEVWLCSGQSNMEFAVNRAANAAGEIAAAHFPLLRHIRIEHTVATAPLDTLKAGDWKPATPENVGAFTAVGYFFARDLHLKLGVPIGIIHSSWGGTPVESWMSGAALASDPAFRIIDERWQQNLAAYPGRKEAYDVVLAGWSKAASEATARGAAPLAAFLKQRPRPAAPRGPGDSWTPGGLFRGMINPLLPVALRGVLWYQGESNAERASEYHGLFAAMITAWRAHFGQGDIPFYWVSLANYKLPGDPTNSTYAFLREAQTQTLSLPNTGQAIAIDVGDPNDIHPADKQTVGARLALLAKNRIYGVTGDDTGPTFAGMAREGRSLRVRFASTNGVLVAHDKPVQSLEVAGADRVFRPAVGKIERETLLVSSAAVKEPVAVRYAWQNAPEANLYSGAGLPAVPFRSDAW